MDMGVDMIDPGQRDVMMLAVGRCALGELDFVWTVQVVDSPDLDAVRSNDVHMLGDLAPEVSCGSGQTSAAAIVVDLDFGMPNGIADILRTVRCLFSDIAWGTKPIASNCSNTIQWPLGSRVQ